MIAIGDIVLYRPYVHAKEKEDVLPAVVLRRHGDGSLNLFVMSDRFDDDGPGGRVVHDVLLGSGEGQWRHIR